MSRRRRPPIIVWGAPPPAGPRRRRPKYAAFVEALHDRPGEWACLQRSEVSGRTRSLAYYLRGPAYQALAHPYHLEVISRRTPGGDYGVWARLVEPGA